MPNLGPKPERPAEILALTKAYVAQSQLETAIGLWFYYGDPMSIHTLAAAANECYHGIGRKAGSPTQIATWKKTLSKKAYNRAVAAQNFGKHGNTDADGTLHLKPEYAELLMLDSVICHEKIYKSRSALMSCFFARLAFESPRLLASLNLRRREQGREEIIIEKFVHGNRVEYLDEALPVFLASRGGG